MDISGSYPKSLKPPVSSTTLITKEIIAMAVRASRESPRRRIIYPLHKGPKAIIHRMLNAIQPESYIQPHRHCNPPKSESVIVLQGEILNFIFTDRGIVREIQHLGGTSLNLGVDSEPGVFHTFLALEEDTVLFEAKPGPYVASSDKDFAPWAPKEGEAECKSYMKYLYDLAENFNRT